MNKKMSVVVKLFLLLLVSPGMFAQNSRVTWYAIDAGFAVPSSPVTAVKSLAGGVVGTLQLANTRIESGFLADTLFRGFLTGVNQPPMLPAEYELKQNYPNPFNPSTKIDFSIPERTKVTIRVMNLLGEEVARPIDGVTYDAGTKSVEFSADDLPSGTYIYRMDAGNFSASKRMVLLK